MNRHKIILHYGPHKTGTSSIQTVFWNNRASLAKYNLAYYPVAGCIYGAHHNLAWETLQDKRFDPSKGGWSQLLAELSNLTHPATVLLSTEEFSRISLSTMSHAFHALKAHDVTILYFYRPLASFIESLHAEEVKDGMTCLGIDDYTSEKIKFDHCVRIGEYFQELIDVFEVNVSVIPYGKDVLPDLIDYLRIPAAVPQEPHINTRLPKDKLQYILGHRRRHCAMDWHTYFYTYASPYLNAKMSLDAEPAPEADFILSKHLVDQLNDYDAQNLRLFNNHHRIEFCSKYSKNTIPIAQ